MNSPIDDPKFLRAEDQRSADRDRVSSRECQTPSSFMNKDGLPPPAAASEDFDVIQKQKGAIKVGMSHQNSMPTSSKTVQRPKPWHDVICDNLSNEFSTSYRSDPLLHAAMPRLNMKSCRRNTLDNSITFSFQNPTQQNNRPPSKRQDSDILKSKVGTNRAMKISRESQVTPRSNVVTSEGFTPKTPELYYESTFSRMYTKMVNKKLVLVSHPYDLPFAEKYFQEKATQLTSPFTIHSEMSSPRNISLPSTTNWKQVASRYDKIDYGSQNFVSPRETHSKSGTSASKESQDSKTSKIVTYEPEVLFHKLKRAKPIEISQQLLNYYSQLVDPDYGCADNHTEEAGGDSSLQNSSDRRRQNGFSNSSFRFNSKTSKNNRKLQILSSLDIKSSRNLELNHRRNRNILENS